MCQNFAKIMLKVRKVQIICQKRTLSNFVVFFWQNNCRKFATILPEKCRKIRNYCSVLLKWEFFIKWERPTCSHPHSSTPLFWRKEGAKQAALILMKNSHFNRTPLYLYHSHRWWVLYCFPYFASLKQIVYLLVYIYYLFSVKEHIKIWSLFMGRSADISEISNYL